jgi:hypothetical protein
MLSIGIGALRDTKKAADKLVPESLAARLAWRKSAVAPWLCVTAFRRLCSLQRFASSRVHVSARGPRWCGNPRTADVSTPSRCTESFMGRENGAFSTRYSTSAGRRSTGHKFARIGYIFPVPTAARSAPPPPHAGSVARGLNHPHVCG